METPETSTTTSVGTESHQLETPTESSSAASHLRPKSSPCARGQRLSGCQGQETHSPSTCTRDVSVNFSTAGSTASRAARDRPHFEITSITQLFNSTARSRSHMETREIPDQTRQMSMKATKLLILKKLATNAVRPHTGVRCP